MGDASPFLRLTLGDASPDSWAMEKELLTEIEAFLVSNDMSASRFGEAAISDKNLVRDLRGGRRRLLIQTAERIRAFMARGQS